MLEIGIQRIIIKRQFNKAVGFETCFWKQMAICEKVKVRILRFDNSCGIPFELKRIAIDPARIKKRKRDGIMASAIA
jgi:hypothetical protein